MARPAASQTKNSFRSERLGGKYNKDLRIIYTESLQDADATILPIPEPITTVTVQKIDVVYLSRWGLYCFESLQWIDKNETSPRSNRYSLNKSIHHIWVRN